VDEPFPLRRAALGCAALALVGAVLALLIGPLVSLFALPAEDEVAVVGTVEEVGAGPVRREVVMSTARGWDGERPLGGGRVQLPIIVAPSPQGGFTAVAASSPAAEDCPVEIGPDRLVDCAGRAWTYAGLPVEPGLPALDRFATTTEAGLVRVDLTRSLGE
jgi:hypothetical protein